MVIRPTLANTHITPPGCCCCCCCVRLLINSNPLGPRFKHGAGNQTGQANKRRESCQLPCLTSPPDYAKYSPLFAFCTVAAQKSDTVSKLFFYLKKLKCCNVTCVYAQRTLKASSAEAAVNELCAECMSTWLSHRCIQG